MAKILEVKVEVTPDDSPDTSWIGEFSDRLDDWDIITEGEHEGEFVRDVPDDELPSRGRNYRGFKPYAGGEKPGSSEYARYAKQDWAVMRRLVQGDLWFVGITAKARVMLRPGPHGGVTQTVSSGGLWGIESDAYDYHKEVAKEQLAELRDELEAMGFSKRAIDDAFEKVEDEF